MAGGTDGQGLLAYLAGDLCSHQDFLWTNKRKPTGSFWCIFHHPVRGSPGTSYHHPHLGLCKKCEYHQERSLAAGPARCLPGTQGCLKHCWAKGKGLPLCQGSLWLVPALAAPPAPSSALPAVSSSSVTVLGSPQPHLGAAHGCSQPLVTHGQPCGAGSP